jgi:Flp pilus assembly protein CpaB
MLVAGALGVALTLSALRAADTSRPVLALGRDAAAGTMLAAGDLRATRVHASGTVLANLFTPRDAAALAGAVLATNVHAGALLTRDELRAPDVDSASRVMSFPLARAHAVAGKLTSGDRVDVVAVDHETKRARYVLTDSEVVAFDTRGAGPLASASDDVTVTVLVDADSATRLAAALDNGTVTLVRHG